MTDSTRYRLTALTLLLALPACGGSGSGVALPPAAATAANTRVEPLSLRPLPRIPVQPAASPTPTPDASPQSARVEPLSLRPLPRVPGFPRPTPDPTDSPALNRP